MKAKDSGPHIGDAPNRQDQECSRLSGNKVNRLPLFFDHVSQFAALAIAFHFRSTRRWVCPVGIKIGGVSGVADPHFEPEVVSQRDELMKNHVVSDTPG